MRYKNLFLPLIVLLSAISCQKSGTSPEEKKEITPPISNVDVYVGGRLGNYAAYWKNDEIHQVNNTEGSSSATSIAVQGNDVYLAGYSSNTSGEKIITFWKNGVPTYLKNLGNSTADGALGIAVHGNDVYVIGRTERATLWKNGVASYISNDENSFAYAITITNTGDIYIGGRNDRRACYWKNGTLVYAGEKDRDSWAFTMCVSGSDVYTAGYINEDNSSAVFISPVYWKNNIITKLPIINGLHSLRALGIAVNGSDVYLAGTGMHSGPPIGYVKALYWKNGVVKDISSTDNQTIQYIANAVAVNGTDVYVAASANGRGYFLKNSLQITLETNGTNSFDYKAITIVPK